MSIIIIIIVIVIEIQCPSGHPPTGLCIGPSFCMSISFLKSINLHWPSALLKGYDAQATWDNRCAELFHQIWPMC